MNINQKTKIGVSASLVMMAILRLVFYDLLNVKMDLIFFSLLAFAFVVLFFPWEQLRSFKAGGVEFLLENRSVKTAISGLNLERLKDEELKNKLSKLNDELQLIKGSRILWVDDKPHNILGARRVLRSLGVDITIAISSDVALEILTVDNDFDLIISDVQRKGENYKQVDGGVEIHDGVNFIVVLRKHEDEAIKFLPVIYYAAYSWERLIEFTRPAREFQPEAEVSNAMEDFLPKVINRLADVRTKPILFKAIKNPTSVN